jgi:hypothetical protein
MKLSATYPAGYAAKLFKLHKMYMDAWITADWFEIDFGIFRQYWMFTYFNLSLFSVPLGAYRTLGITNCPLKEVLGVNGVLGPRERA